MTLNVSIEGRLITIANAGPRTFATLRKSLDEALRASRDKDGLLLLVDWRQLEGVESSALTEQWNVAGHIPLIFKAVAFVAPDRWQRQADRGAELFNSKPQDIVARVFADDQFDEAKSWLEDFNT